MNYSEFRKRYEEQHPASIPKLEFEMSDHPQWLIWAVAAMFIASALMSGVHTVPTAYDTIEALKVAEPIRQLGGMASFIFVELGILVSAYILFKNWSFWVFIILAIAVIIAMVANLYSVSEALQVNGDLGMTIVAVALGLGAPLIATLSGKVFVGLHRSDRIIDTRARAKFKEDSIAWDKEIERAWKAELKAGPSRVSSVQLSNEVSNGQSNVSAAASLVGHTKVPDASQKVRDYLSDNPDALYLSPRQLAELLRVGKSTVNNVQREMRDAVASNGHSNGNGNGNHNGHARD